MIEFGACKRRAAEAWERAVQENLVHIESSLRDAPGGGALGARVRRLEPRRAAFLKVAPTVETA